MADAPAPDARISLFGGVRVHLADGTAVDPLPPKCQELLAALALDPGAPITVGRLVALMWGDDAPRTAEKTLQTYVARIRRELGSEAIARAGAAYRLDVDPAVIDVSRFKAALRAGDIETALLEWTGPPLAGMVSERLQPLVDGLTEEWLDALEADLERRVLEDPGTVVGRLTELVAAYPFREGMCALLMTALYRSDRQAEALEAYRRMREFLIDQLGVEPGPRLRDLEQLILQQDDGLVAAADPRRRRAAVAGPSGTVTFGFAELDNAASLWSTHRVEAADVAALFTDIATSLANDHRGVVFSTGTDGPGVAFDSARSACAWATALHASFATTPWPHGEPVFARIGLHTGEADERGGSYYGPSVTLAQQLAACASPGQTVSTSIAVKLADCDHLELGTFSIDGIPGTQELYQVGTGSFSPLRVVASSVDQVPRPANTLLGREELAARITEALPGAPIITLIGPGGIGKTRLAIEIARRTDRTNQRIWFVSLAEITDAADIPRTLADVIGARESDTRTLIDAIAASLGARPSLLVLDNCEHVIDGVTAVVTTLTDRCPDLTVLATSQEALGLDREQVQPVGPLDTTTAAAELFIERAQALDPDLELDRQTVEAVCRRLDGVPLAIELAAATARSLAPADLLGRLDEMFTLLTGSRRRTVGRHRTLRATIQWSYDLLSSDEQTLFRRLAVFHGSFDLRAAEDVAADQQLPRRGISALISDLVDRSMCQVETGTAGRQFRLLEPMRQFSLEYLYAAEPVDDLRRRHAEHTRRRVIEIQQLLAGPDEVQGAAELAELWPNLRGAIDFAVDAGDLRLASELIEPIAAQGFLRRGLGEIGDWFARIVDVATPTDGEAVDVALLWTALYAQQTESRETFDRLAARATPVDSNYSAAAIAIINGDSETLLANMSSTVADAERRGDPVLAWVLRIMNAGNLLRTGQLDETDDYLRDLIQRTELTLPPTLLSWLLFMDATLREVRGEEPDGDPYDRIAAIEIPPRTNSPTPTLAARRAARLGDYHGAYALLLEHVEDLIVGDNANGALVVALELVNLLLSSERTQRAATILGQLDAAGVDDIGGFDKLLSHSRQHIDADPVTASARQNAAENPAPSLLEALSDCLTSLVTQS